MLPHLRDCPCHCNVNNPWLHEHHSLYPALSFLCSSYYDLIYYRCIFLLFTVSLFTLYHKPQVGKGMFTAVSLLLHQCLETCQCVHACARILLRVCVGVCGSDGSHWESVLSLYHMESLGLVANTFTP